MSEFIKLAIALVLLYVFVVLFLSCASTFVRGI